MSWSRSGKESRQPSVTAFAASTRASVACSGDTATSIASWVEEGAEDGADIDKQRSATAAAAEKLTCTGCTRIAHSF
jgi:hypothetical protein